MEFLIIAALIVLVGLVTVAALALNGQAIGAGAAAIGAVILLVAVTLFASYSQIGSHQEGIYAGISGVWEGSLGPGTHTVPPWDSVTTVDTGVESAVFPNIEAFSKESQTVYLNVQVNYHLDPTKILQLYRTVGSGWYDKFIPGAVNQDAKEETTHYLTVNIAPNRAVISSDLEKSLRRDLAPHSIFVDSVYLVNVSYSKAFEHAIELKQISSQKAAQAVLQAETQKNLAQGARDANIARAQGKAQATLLEADAQAKANKIISASLTSSLIRYQLVNKLSPNVKVFLPSGSNIYTLGGLLGSK